MSIELSVCGGCGRSAVEPVLRCARCGSASVHPEPCPGTGSVIATTRTDERRFAVIELAVGVRLLAFDDTAGPLAIGDPVEVERRSDGTFRLLLATE